MFGEVRLRWSKVADWLSPPCEQILILHFFKYLVQNIKAGKLCYVLTKKPEMVCSCQRVFKNIRHDLLFFLTFIYFREGQYFKTRLFFLNFCLGGPFSASNSKKITHAEILGDPYRTEFFVWLVYLFHFYLILFPLIRG